METNLLKWHLEFVFNDMFGRDMYVVVAIIRPKTRYRASRLQSVIVRDHLTVRLSSFVMSTCADRSQVIPMTQAQFAHHFETLLNVVSKPPLPYTPASLRGGGAIYHFNKNRSLSELMFAGRWDSMKTLSHYMQEGLATSALCKLDPHQHSVCVQLSQSLPRFVDSIID